MTTVTIATVVEGHGEVEAVPLLLRRIVADVAPGLYINVPRPYRIGRHALARPDGLENVVRTQGDRVVGRGGVLVLIDADDDCPAELAPQLLDRALAARPEWLSGKRPGRPYKETADQAALTQRFNMNAARKQSPSFEKLWRDVERLISE